MGAESSKGEDVRRNSHYPAGLIEVVDVIVGVERIQNPDSHAEIFSRIATEGLELVIEKRIKDRTWPGGRYTREESKQLRESLRQRLEDYRQTSG